MGVAWVALPVSASTLLAIPPAHRMHLLVAREDGGDKLHILRIGLDTHLQEERWDAARAQPIFLRAHVGACWRLLRLPDSLTVHSLSRLHLFSARVSLTCVSVTHRAESFLGAIDTFLECARAGEVLKIASGLTLVVEHYKIL